MDHSPNSLKIIKLRIIDNRTAYNVAIVYSSKITTLNIAISNIEF